MSYPGVWPSARAAAVTLAGLSTVAAAAAPGWFGLVLLLDAAALIGLVVAGRAVAVAVAAPAAPARPAGAHPVSGLPMREALLARMQGDGAGVFGAIAFADFDRLSAFDPALSERVFTAITDRLRAMLPPARFVAQVDRGRIGMWFGGGRPAEAQAELDAIRYALGQAIEADSVEIVPEIRLRLGDHRAGADPAATVAQTLAAFALPDGVAAAPTTDVAAHERERYALEQDLRQAIARRELHLVYQPLVDAGQGCVSGAEALIRWQHATLGPVSPTRFVPVMEETGLAGEIGLWALNTALREAHEWAAHGLRHLRVAVNVSALQLEAADLPILIGRTLSRHDLPATALEIELTESVATSDSDHCRCIFQELRALGVSLAVDDFGTGYSGFSSLRTLAFDKIKIDREFVTEVDRRRDSQAICQSIVALGRGLGIRVLAEGVERQEEYEWLRRHGCQHFQGYYFAPPLAPSAFHAFAQDAAGLAALLRPGEAPVQERLSA